MKKHLEENLWSSGVTYVNSSGTVTTDHGMAMFARIRPEPEIEWGTILMIALVCIALMIMAADLLRSALALDPEDDVEMMVDKGVDLGAPDGDHITGYAHLPDGQIICKADLEYRHVVPDQEICTDPACPHGQYMPHIHVPPIPQEAMRFFPEGEAEAHVDKLEKGIDQARSAGFKIVSHASPHPEAGK